MLFSFQLIDQLIRFFYIMNINCIATVVTSLVRILLDLKQNLLEDEFLMGKRMNWITWLKHVGVVGLLGIVL
jgi:hypothetical protein